MASARSHSTKPASTRSSSPPDAPNMHDGRCSRSATLRLRGLRRPCWPRATRAAFDDRRRRSIEAEFAFEISPAGGARKGSLRHYALARGGALCSRRRSVPRCGVARSRQVHSCTRPDLGCCSTGGRDEPFFFLTPLIAMTAPVRSRPTIPPTRVAVGAYASGPQRDRSGAREWSIASAYSLRV
jgi:hypothetical protein